MYSHAACKPPVALERQSVLQEQCLFSAQSQCMLEGTKQQ